MKKVTFLLSALAVVGLTSCQSDEVIENYGDNTPISFAVTSNNPTRAAQSYCNNNKPEQVNVKAMVGTQEYFKITLDKQTDGSYKPSVDQYWPATAEVDFYAWANGDATIDNGALKFSDFTVENEVASQKDLIFAVNKGLTKPQNTNTPVTLNFRHALSQVVFQAYNATSNYKVEVYAVSVGHLYNKGTFTFASTDGNKNTNEGYVWHEDGNKPENKTNNGTWACSGDATTVYEVDVKSEGQPVTLATSSSNPSVLTSVKHAGGPDNSLILMPQKQDAWNPQNTTSSSYNGAYFLLKVKITNKETGAVVYGGEDGSDAAIPVAIDWKPGVRYIYTFHFNDGGTGGYTPNPDNPQPVLTAITYTLTVDDFVPADDKGDIKMDKVDEPKN